MPIIEAREIVQRVIRASFTEAKKFQTRVNTFVGELCVAIVRKRIFSLKTFSAYFYTENFVVKVTALQGNAKEVPFRKVRNHY